MGIQALLDTQVLTATGSTGDVMTVQADGSYLAATPSVASPGGSSGQIQYNNAGAFGGTVAVVYAGSGSHLSVTAQAATDVPVTVQGAVSQSANLLEINSSGGSAGDLLKVESNGRATSAYGYSAPKTNNHGYHFGDASWGLSYTFGTWINLGAGSCYWRFYNNGTLMSYATSITLRPGASSTPQTATLAGNDVNIDYNVAGQAICTGGNHSNGNVGGYAQLKGGDSNGTDIAGASVYVQAGRGTGAGVPGEVVFRTAPATGPGAVLQTLIDVGKFDGTTTAGDTAMLLYDVDSAALTRVVNNGSLLQLSGPTVSPSFVAQAATDVPVTVQGAVSQSANLTEWKDSAGAVLSSMSSAGRLSLPDTGISLSSYAGALGYAGGWLIVGNLQQAGGRLRNYNNILEFYGYTYDNTITTNVLGSGWGNGAAIIFNISHGSSASAGLGTAMAGGAFKVNAGPGNAASGSGGAISLTAGAGGANTYAGSGGAGGDINITGGVGGATNGAGGSVYIAGGAASASGPAGNVVLGDSVKLDLNATAGETRMLLYDVDSAALTRVVNNGSLLQLSGPTVSPSFVAQAATDVPVTVQGAVSQTANLQEWKNSSGTSLAYVYPDGRIRVGAGSFTAGGVELGSTNYRLSVHSSGIYIVSNNSNTLFVSSSDVRLKAGSQLAFSNNASFASNPASSGIEQVSGGVLRVTDGGSNTADLIVRNLRMSAPTLVPASASATGSEGQIAWDADYIYICTATDTWKRVAIATW
jgi:ribose 5-phosphate isomerase RpiB